MAFLEASFSQSTASDGQGWRDISDTDSFRFHSAFGQVSIRRRTSHPATYAYVAGSTLVFGYGQSERTHHAPDRITDDPGLEHLTITADATDKTVSIDRDMISTLPLFIGYIDDGLHVSNDYCNVYTSLDSASLTPDLDAIRDLLNLRPSHRTLFKQIEALYDRMHVTWSAIGLRRFPAAPRHYATTSDFPTTDARQFFEAVESTVARYWQRYVDHDQSAAAAELSCGMDSSMICGFLAGHSRLPLQAATLNYDGRFRESVRSRLKDMQAQFNFSSQEITMDSGADFPLSQYVSDDGTLRPFYIEDDLYGTSTIKLAAYYQQFGCSAVFRGVGGDELFENITTNDLSPTGTHQTLLSASVATSGLSSANAYIERGIWPVLPFADLALYYFCQGLPMRYRHERDIMRAYLHARKYPDSVIDPTSNEHFGEFFSSSVGNNLSELFERLMEHPILAITGIIDPQECLTSWRSATQNRQQIPFRLFRVLQAEITLRQHAGEKVTLHPSAT